MDERKKMLIVDDHEVNRSILWEIFENEYEIVEAENGKIAMDYIKSHIHELSIILLDIVMPEMDGFAVLEEMEKLDYLSLAPVIVITSMGDGGNEERMLDMGATDLINKPFKPSVVKRRVRNVANAQVYKSDLEAMTFDLSARLKKTNALMAGVISSLVEYRTMESNGHVFRIQNYTETLLRQVLKCGTIKTGIDNVAVDTIVDACALHDIGKIVIPDSILNKKDRLTDSEFEMVKCHTFEGGKIIKQFAHIHDVEYMRYAYDIACYHHERWNGEGYPDGLSGTDIPLWAQIVGLADAYEALTTNRPYRFRYAHTIAVDMICNGECGVFSPDLIFAFKQCQNVFEMVSKKYADSNESEEVPPKAADGLWIKTTVEDYRGDYLKYVTALRILDCYAVEVDYSTGTYKFVFPKTVVFPDIPTEGNFAESVDRFVSKYVHDMSKQKLLKKLKQHEINIATGFITEGKSDYSIFNPMEKRFKLHEISFVNVGARAGTKNNILIIIRDIDDQMERERRLSEYERREERNFER